MDNINEKQPHIVITLHDGDVAVVPMYLLRQVASGQHIADNDLSRAIAVALLDYLDGC